MRACGGLLRAPARAEGLPAVVGLGPLPAQKLAIVSLLLPSRCCQRVCVGWVGGLGGGALLSSIRCKVKGLKPNVNPIII